MNQIIASTIINATNDQCKANNIPEVAPRSKEWNSIYNGFIAQGESESFAAQCASTQEEAMLLGA